MTLLVLALLITIASSPAGSDELGVGYYTDEDIRAIRERAQEPEYREAADAVLAKADAFASRSDDDIWQLIPEADLPRALNVRFGVGCPVHGREVFRKGANYPWIMSPDQPFKVQCPVGGEVYPSNDFEAYLRSGRKEPLDTTERYVDDGSGWVDEEGNRYWFVAHYVFWTLWRGTILGGLQACANAYVLTGEPRYAHKCAVALARISQVYPDMDYSKQAYHNGKWPAGINGRILDYIWENSTVTNFAVSYDSVYGTLDSDEELKKLAAAHGIGDVRRSIEENLLQPAARDIFAKKIWGNKFELGSLSAIALALSRTGGSSSPTTREMVEWLLKGEGDLEFTFYNGFDRDGMGGEMSPGYSQIWNYRFTEAAENLARLGVDIVNDRKWLRIARAPSEMRVLNTLCPRIGDQGGVVSGGGRMMSSQLFRFGVDQFADPYCADLYLETFNPAVELLSRRQLSRDDLQRLGRKASFPEAPYTRDMGGYGLAILEMGSGEDTRSATMYYGATGASHGHRDRLTMSYHMRGRDILTEMGYPLHWGPEADWWIKNTPSHYCAMIDGKAQPSKAAGNLTMFVNEPGLKLAEAQAARIWNGAAEDYRRMLALADLDGEAVVLIDAFFVSGGSQHDYLFHGLPFGEFQTNAPLLRMQVGGTVADPWIQHGEDPGDDRRSSGFQFLARPRWHEPQDVLRLQWLNDDGLNLHAWFPRLAFSEMIVADGRPPQRGGNPEWMEFALLRGTGADLSSLFLGVIDAGYGKPQVRQVDRITSDTPTAGGAVVTTSKGSRFRIYINGSGSEAVYQDGSRGSAPFVIVRSDGHILALAGSGAFTSTQGRARVLDPQNWQVDTVDYQNGIVTLRNADGGPLPAEGTVVVARTGVHSASYSVRSVKRDANGDIVIGFGDIGLITGRFQASWDTGAGRIKAQERTGGVYNSFVARSFEGMTAVTEDFSASAVIASYDADANTFALDADAERSAGFRDSDGDGRPYMYISDFGPGTVMEVTPVTTARRRPAN